MNPHKKETRFIHYLEEELFRAKHWHDTGIWAEAGGPSLIICSLNISTSRPINMGVRFVDENNKPLVPYRTLPNTRRSAHFAAEPNMNSYENLCPITFHMIVNCKYVKLQLFPDDGDGFVYINRVLHGHPTDATDGPWSHKTISTMTAIPLLPHYQGGANTVFTYPKSRMPDKDKTKLKPAGPSAP